MAIDIKSYYLPAVIVVDLLARASTSERPVLERLATAAGILWRCRHAPCGAATPCNHDGPRHDVCGRCGRGR